MKEKGRYVEIPATQYPAIDQGAVVVKSSQNKDVARQFLAFLKTSQILELLRGYGFAVPEGAAGKP